MIDPLVVGVLPLLRLALLDVSVDLSVDLSVLSVLKLALDRRRSSLRNEGILVKLSSAWQTETSPPGAIGIDAS